MAHLLLERMLARHGADGAIRVRSGGIANYARDGMIASLDARIALRDEGILLGENDFVSTDLRRHRDHLAGADVILTMPVLQKQMLASGTGPARRGLPPSPNSNVSPAGGASR